MSIARPGEYNPPRMDPKLPVGTAGTLAGDVPQEEVEVSPELRARILRQIDQVMAVGRVEAGD